MRAARRSAAHTSALAVAALFLVGSVLAVVLVTRSLREQTIREATTTAERALDRNLALHGYFDQELKPAVQPLLGEATDPSYFAPSWMAATYAVRRIHARYRHIAGDAEPSGYRYKECAINARSPENEADEQERTFLARAAADPTLETWSGVRELEGRKYLVVLRRGETLDRSCLRCHGDPVAAPAGLLKAYGPIRSFGRREGELISVMSVHVPLASAYASTAGMAVQLSTALLVALAAVLGLLLLVQRWLFTVPLRSLSAQARALAEDPKAVAPARLPRSRELRALTRLFNTAARTVARRDELLERAVRERTRALEEAQQRLALADRLATVGTMAAGMTHEINNPLSYVLANVGFLAGELRLPESKAASRDELLHAALDAVSGADRVRAIIQGLKAFAHERSGALELVDVGPALGAAVELCRREIDGCAELQVRIAEGLPRVRAREHELGQVFVNLLANAAHAMPPRPRHENAITVEARLAGPHVVVEIRDNGVGIPPEVLPRVFDPFFTTRPVGQGTGLGLSICHGIVRRSGGLIEIESELGRGAVVRVLLPAVAGHRAGVAV